MLIDSAPGRGTEVPILLPRGSESVRRRSEPQVSAVEPETGSGETVLVVGDDALVRAAMAETLGDLGYRVMEAMDADEALAMLDGGVAADVVLSDVMMPGGMNGVEFAAAARLRFPALPVVLATGHVGTLDGRPLSPGMDLLPKPLGRGAIAAAVRRALTDTREAVGA